MKKYKNLIFYITTIGGLSGIIYWLLVRGAELEKGRGVVTPITEQTQWQQFLESFSENLGHPLALLLAQILTIIFVARIFGWICGKIGQPTVIGEMIAGIVLGPSLVGMYFPEFSGMLFPQESLGNLQFISQIGLILFMYIVGMELDLKVLRNKAHDAVVISHASIIFPFFLGSVLAYFIYAEFAPAGTQFTAFALFIGIAMSITAFPVLARIVQERGIHKSRLGTIVITCAAADDITAWCILAAVIAITKAGSFGSSVFVIILAVIYVLMMIKLVKPFLKRVADSHGGTSHLSKPIIAIFFLTLVISSYLTEIIGIHALFGAFMAGAIMPENAKFRNIFIQKVEDVALVLFLPLFFVFTGLRTQIGLLDDPYLWKMTGVIILVAIVGKFVGSALAAKFVGQNWKNSLSIGALMNTRGLMELVVLNIGYDLGVLGPEIFAMMVIMALVTTFMTGPALDIINWAFKRKKQEDEITQEINEVSKFKILFWFNTSESGKALVRLANSFTQKLNGNAVLTALHIPPADSLHNYDINDYEKNTFQPIVHEAQNINQNVTTLFKVSNEVESEITTVANRGNYDLLLIELGKSIYEGTLLGRVLGFTTRIINPEKLLNTVTGRDSLFDTSILDERTKVILSKSNVTVGIFINKGFTQPDKVFIPIFSENDLKLISYAQKLIHNSESQVTILDAVGLIKSSSAIKERIRAIEQNAPNHIALQNERMVEKEFLKQQDIMIVSFESWKKLVESKSIWLSDIPSTLIIENKE